MVCTGNINRSPLGEALLRDRLAARGVEASVSSAGTRATGGPAAAEVVEILADLGLDGTAHVSRPLTPELVGGADLVLGMAREHVREAVVACPTAFDRAFTLKELARRAGDAGPRGGEAPVDAWLARLGAGRSLQDLLGAGELDDVADPIGKRRAAFDRCAAEIAALVDEVVPLLAPAAAPLPTSPHRPGGR